jgi:hypothetical protein
VVAYLSISVPTIAAGFAAPHLGLETTFRLFGAAVVAIALVVSLAASGAFSRGRLMAAASP